MVIVRPYKIGDVEKIRRTTEFERDFYENGAVIVRLLENGDSWTFEREGLVICCANAAYQYNGWYELFAVYHKEMRLSDLRAIKKHFNQVMPRYKKVYTISIDTYRNNKWHTFLGFHYVKTIRGHNIWERQHKI